MRRAHRHADTIGKALAERPGSDLDAWRQSVFGMAWSLRAPLAKVLNLIQRQIVTGEIEQGVKQHAAVAR